jgi:hypothetical protein
VPERNRDLYPAIRRDPRALRSRLRQKRTGRLRRGCREIRAISERFDMAVIVGLTACPWSAVEESRARRTLDRRRR